jgi:hypothetical protein
MVGIGLWIRLGITETPVFQKVLDEERVERVPVLEILKRQPKSVALTALLMPSQRQEGVVRLVIAPFRAFQFRLKMIDINCCGLLQLSGDIRRESVRRSTLPPVLGVLRILSAPATRAAS